MVHEITNTKDSFKKYPPVPDGRRRYVVTAPVKKLFGKNGAEFFVWALQYQNEHGENCLGEQVLLPSMMGGLLRVLGCEETTPDHFDWDTDDMEGLAFTATTSHAPDKKDPLVDRVHMSEFSTGDTHEDQPEIPFGDSAA